MHNPSDKVNYRKSVLRSMFVYRVQEGRSVTMEALRPEGGRPSLVREQIAA